MAEFAILFSVSATHIFAASINAQEVVMSRELMAELLDLTVTEKGFGGAMYAAMEEPGCSCGGCSTVVLCTILCHICW